MVVRKPEVLGRNEMPVTVYIPTPFRKLAGNQTHVDHSVKR